MCNEKFRLTYSLSSGIFPTLLRHRRRQRLTVGRPSPPSPLSLRRRIHSRQNYPPHFRLHPD